MSHERQLKLPPEDKLLLQCVRIHRTSAEFETVKELAGGNINWAYVIDKALAHGVMPLLYRSLCAFCQDSVPEAAYDRLRNLYRANAQRNLLLTSALVKILDLFAANAISAIPLKGPVLSISAYGDLSLRQFRDLDILVRKRDIFAAKDLLVSAGYRPYLRMTAAQELSHIESYHAFVFLADSGNCSVDLHWTITQQQYSFPFDTEAFWDQLDRISFAGRTILTLAPEQMILILCIHGSKHWWEQLNWICDIAEHIRSHPSIDWQRVMHEAQNLHSLKAVLLALVLAKNLLDVSLPNQVIDAIERSAQVQRVSGPVTNQLLRGRRGVLLPALQRMLLVLWMKERIRDRFSYLLYEVRRAVAPNPKDYSVVSLPRALCFLYYIMRAVRLTITYALIPAMGTGKRTFGRNTGEFLVAQRHVGKKIAKETL